MDCDTSPSKYPVNAGYTTSLNSGQKLLPEKP